MTTSASLGVVLDFDGVIADSMRLHAEAYRRVLSVQGVPVRDADVYLREGARSETLIRDLARIRGKALDAREAGRLATDKQRIFEALGPPKLYPGAEALVRRVRARVDRLGLVTGTRRTNLERLIPHLLPLFDAVLAQDAYHHDKPHPEPYEKSAQALGVPPASCAALENAIRGVQSARAAGYGLVLGITTTLTRAQLEAAGAHEVVPDHGAALKALQAWARREKPGPQR